MNVRLVGYYQALSRSGETHEQASRRQGCRQVAPPHILWRRREPRVAAFLQATRTLVFWAFRRIEDVIEARRNALDGLSCWLLGTLREAGQLGMIDWLLGVYVSVAPDWHVALFHLKKLSNELREHKHCPIWDSE